MADLQSLQEQDSKINGVGAAPATENLTAAKRHRRPSVRLGEIGDQPAATATLFHESQRRPKQWRLPSGKDIASGKSSKTRQLAKLGAGSYQHREETLDFEGEDWDTSYDNLAIGSWKSKDFKSKRVPKKPRANWLPKIEEDDGFDRDFVHKGLRSSSKEESPANSPDNLGAGQSTRWRDEIELAGESETDRNNGSQDGVKNWLDGLGLGKYFPIFEIHEVDEEVLPFLTLEDLKEMGICAIGSRRKIFNAIEKLGKGFS